MKASDERILTTHAGSLPRTTALTDLLIRREQGKPFDQAEFDREVDRALDVAVGKQLACGTRHRQRRRDAADRVFHLRGRAHERLRR